MQQLLTAAVLLQLITVASPSFMHGVLLRPPARAAIALTDIELPSSRSMEFATQQSLRKVAMYRASVETEVKNLRAQLETSSKEAEQKASSAGLSLPDDWALPMQMATKRTLRQVEVYGASMEAEVDNLREQLEKEAEAGRAAKEELVSESRKKEMHYGKAKQFYAEAAAAKQEAAELKAALESVQAELDQLRGKTGT